MENKLMRILFISDAMDVACPATGAKGGTSARAKKAQTIRARKDLSAAAKQDRAEAMAGQGAPRLTFHDDNEAMIEVRRTGDNPTMRHIGRAHGVSVAFMYQ